MNLLIFYSRSSFQEAKILLSNTELLTYGMRGGSPLEHRPAPDSPENLKFPVQLRIGVGIIDTTVLPS